MNEKGVDNPVPTRSFVLFPGPPDPVTPPRSTCSKTVTSPRKPVTKPHKSGNFRAVGASGELQKAHRGPQCHDLAEREEHAAHRSTTIHRSTPARHPSCAREPHRLRGRSSSLDRPVARQALATELSTRLRSSVDPPVESGLQQTWSHGSCIGERGHGSPLTNNGEPAGSAKRHSRTYPSEA